MEGLSKGNGACIASAFYSSVTHASADTDVNLVLTPRSVMEAKADSCKLPPNTSEIQDVEINNNMTLVKVKIDMPPLNYYDCHEINLFV